MNVGYTPYEGMNVTGTPMLLYSRTPRGSTPNILECSYQTSSCTRRLT
jgi:hypothetical protein